MKFLAWFGKQNWITKLILIAVLILVIYLIIVLVRKINVNMKKNNVRKAIDSGDFSLSGTTPQGQAYTFNGATVAAIVYDAFYDNDWFGFTEDEDKAIEALLNVPASLMPIVSDAYSRMYEHSLASDCTQYLGNQYSKVQHLFQY